MLVLLKLRYAAVHGRSGPLPPKAVDVLSVDEIAIVVWGYETYGSRNFVEEQISRVRSMLSIAGPRDVIRTYRGAGYAIR